MEKLSRISWIINVFLVHGKKAFKLFYFLFCEGIIYWKQKKNYNRTDESILIYQTDGYNEIKYIIYKISDQEMYRSLL